MCTRREWDVDDTIPTAFFLSWDSLIKAGMLFVSENSNLTLIRNFDLRKSSKSTIRNLFIYLFIYLALHDCMLSLFSHIQLCGTLRTVAWKPPLSMGSPGKNTGVDCHALLQGIFPTQGSNLWLYHLSCNSTTIPTWELLWKYNWFT